MTPRKIVVDTDIILEHLVHTDGPSLLRRVMNGFFCYTTVFNAIEAFSAARIEKEFQAVDDAMSAMKVLGLNAKSAKATGRIFSGGNAGERRALTLLIAGICVESRLPIVTMNPKRFSHVKQIQVLPVQKLLASLRTAN